jgi:hypothetical protein
VYLKLADKLPAGKISGIPTFRPIGGGTDGTRPALS